MISRTKLPDPAPGLADRWPRTGPMPGTSRKALGPPASNHLEHLIAETPPRACPWLDRWPDAPDFIPEPRYFLDLCGGRGGKALRKEALNCWPCSGCFTPGAAQPSTVISHGADLRRHDHHRHQVAVAAGLDARTQESRSAALLGSDALD